MDRGDGLLALSVVMVLSGLGLLVWAGMRGEAEFYLVIIIPVITGTGPVFAAGTLLFIFGAILLMVAWSLRSTVALAVEDAVPNGARPPASQPPTRPQGQPAPRSGVEFGGVVFIGPIPITFGSGPRTGRLMLVAAIAMAVLMIAFFLGLLL